MPKFITSAAEYSDLCWQYAHYFRRNDITGFEKVAVTYDALAAWKDKWDCVAAHQNNEHRE